MPSPSPSDTSFSRRAALAVSDTAAPATRPTLLIVDDEAGPRQALEIVFRNEYEVLLAEDGTTALSQARQQHVAVAVVDIRMSDMTGIEVLEKLKQIDSDIEVIMLTAYETVETAQQALRLGACDYLTKPFDLAVIRQAVSTAMERRSLSEQIRLNNQQLRDLQQQIQDQMMREEMARTKGDIYASIIHDINGPLTVITGFIDLINRLVATTDRLQGRSLMQIKGHLGHITRQITKCIEISRRYLALLHKRSEAEVTVSINQVLNEIKELLVVHPSAQSHELIIRPLPEDLLVGINGTDLSQILLNLAINAFQCSAAPHRVEVAAQHLDAPVDLARYPDGAMVRLLNREGFDNQLPLVALTVQDNGPGIPANVLPKMFEAYFTTKPAGQGTGLGLAIVHRFVREARGALLVQTTPDQGSRFTVYLLARKDDTLS